MACVQHPTNFTGRAPAFSMLPFSTSLKDTSSSSSPQVCDNMAYGGTGLLKNFSNLNVLTLIRRIILSTRESIDRERCHAECGSTELSQFMRELIGSR